MRTIGGTDHFKQVEGMLFKSTINGYDSKPSVSNCLDEWCDGLYGRQVLQSINDYQQQKRCCGWNSATDWVISSRVNHSLPKSCCYGLAEKCSLENHLRLTSGFVDFGQPVRSIIDPTLYSNHCFGPKLLAIILSSNYWQSFAMSLVSNWLSMEGINRLFPSNVRLI